MTRGIDSYCLKFPEQETSWAPNANKIIISRSCKFTEVQVLHWEQFAQAAGLSPAKVKKRIMTLTRQLPSEAAALRSLFAARAWDHDILGAIVGLIERRCQLTCKRLEAAGTGGDEPSGDE